MNAETRAKETCEQRARDITALMVKKLPGTDIALVMEDQAKCVSLITQALRQAENDKLEEAAAAYDEAHVERGLGKRGQPNLFSQWLRMWAKYQYFKKD